MIELRMWIMFTILSGGVEALLFNYTKGLNERFKNMVGFDIHWAFVLIRGASLTPLLIWTSEPFIFGLIALFTFPFIHDGFYYQFRKWLSGCTIYKKGFFDKSPNTTSKLSFGIGTRIVLFLFGAGMVFVII